jgi:hypothetical protein
MRTHDILSIVGGLLIAAIFLVLAIRSLRSGECGPHEGPPEIRGTRAIRPWLYWMFLTGYGSAAAMGVSMALVFAAGSLALPALVAFALFFGLTFVIMAIAVCVYVRFGFSSGRAVMVYRGVYIYDRELDPKSFWMAQFTNIVVTILCAAFGVGAWAIGIWFLGSQS